MLEGSLLSRDQRKIFVTKQSNLMGGNRGKFSGCSFFAQLNCFLGTEPTIQIVPNQHLDIEHNLLKEKGIA